MTASRLNIALDQDGLVLPDSGHIAVLRATSQFDHNGIARQRLRLFNSFRPEFDRLDALDFTVAADFSGHYATSMVEITRSKAETLGLVAMATMATDPGGIVLVDGAKTDGIDSVLKHCKALFQPISVVAKSHGKLFWFTRPENLPLALTEWRAYLTAKRNSAGYLSAPGMFSPDKADPGSTLLAAHFDDRLAGEVADLGAGWGWLAKFWTWSEIRCQWAATGCMCGAAALMSVSLLVARQITGRLAGNNLCLIRLSCVITMCS